MQDKPVLLRLHIGSPYHKDKFIKHTIEEIEKHLANQRNLPILLNCQFKKLAASDQFIGESRNTLWREINQNFYIALLY
jgi:hypothetical protein